MVRCACVLAMVLAAAPVAAQEPLPAVPAGANMAVFSTVFVHDGRGSQIKGKLLRLDDESILVLVNGQERRIELANIWKVEKRGDSLRNGAITGAIVGLGLGALAMGMSECRKPAGGYGSCGVAPRLAIVAVSTGVYASIGTGIDAVIQGRTTLFQRPTMAGAARSGGRRTAVGFTVRW